MVHYFWIFFCVPPPFIRLAYFCDSWPSFLCNLFAFTRLNVRSSTTTDMSDSKSEIRDTPLIIISVFNSPANDDYAWMISRKKHIIRYHHKLYSFLFWIIYPFLACIIYAVMLELFTFELIWQYIWWFPAFDSLILIRYSLNDLFLFAAINNLLFLVAIIL